MRHVRRRGVVALVAIIATVLTALTPALAAPGGNGVGDEMGNGRGSGLPPGLAKRAELPPGLANQDELPPGLANSDIDTVEIQIISYSDWHGQLDPVFSFGLDTNVGGAAALSTYFANDAAEYENTLVITGGDDFGASPPLSSFFDEEPAVLAQNLMGLDVSSLGNHNFDAGIDHLQDMIDLADYSYVSANLENVDDNLDGVDPYRIFDFGDVQVAVVGLTNTDAPELVFPGNFGTIVVGDPVAAANAAREDAEAEGADVFVLVAHEGVTSFDGDDPVGPIVDIAEGVEGFDLILGDHTDVKYAGEVNGTLVVENSSKGVTYARSIIEVEVLTDTIMSVSSTFVDPISDAVEPDGDIVDLLAPYRIDLAAAFDGVIGTTTGFFDRGSGYERLGEAEIGNLVTDSMRLAYDTQIGFTNGGGIRSTLPSSYVPADASVDRDGVFPDDVVIGDAFAILPFGNVVITRTVTGSQLHEMLENGLSELPDSSGRYMQVSGISVVYDSREPSGSRVVSVELEDGTPVPADGTTYTLATNDFMNTGGDGYTMLADGMGTSRDLMAQVFADYIESEGTVSPTFDCRLVDLNPDSVAFARQDCSD